MPVVDTVSDGLDIAVLLFPHEWEKELGITHRVPSSVTAGQSGREGRRPEGEDVRHKLSVRLVNLGDEAQAFRQLLATLGAGWVGVPLWCDIHPGDEWANRKYDPERLWDFTAQVVVNKGDPLDDAHDYAPLLVGHIVELPPESADCAVLADVEFVVVEDSPWALSIGINAVGVAGNWPAALDANWEEGNPEEKAERALEFGHIGNQREQTIDNEESVFRWNQSASFTLASAAEIRTLLAFLVASEGMRKKFTAPFWFKPGTPSAEAPHSTKVRFARDELTLQYLATDLATCKVELAQVPWELVGVEGETPEQPPRVFLYKFTYALPAAQYYRFTNWPKPLARAGDGTYQPAPMLHRDIVDTLDLRGNRVILDTFQFAGNPVELWYPNRIEAKLTLEIWEAETWPIDPDTAVLVFSGDVKRPKKHSRSFEVPVFFLPGFLEHEFPRVRFGPSCNTSLFSAKCGLLRADFLKAGTFTSAAGCVLTIATAAADAANTFVGGTIAMGAGADWEERHIIASEPTGGGQLITVDWPIRQAAAGQAVEFVRGCDRRWETCQALGNQDRFRGHPHIPQVNLSLPTMALPTAPGKK